MTWADDIAEGMEDFLAETGESCTYTRGSESATVTLNKQQQASYWIEVAGMQVEIVPTDFKGMTADLPFGDPRKGDIITDADDVRYEVQPTSGEKCFRRISKAMTRIHSKQIS